MSRTRFAHVVCVMLLATSLSGCGGSGSSTAGNAPSPPTGGSPPEPAIEGIAMPSSVSVVTATNAS